LTDERLIEALKSRPRDGHWLLAHVGSRYLERLRRMRGVKIDCGYPRETYHLFYWIDSNRKTLRRAMQALGIREVGWSS